MRRLRVELGDRSYDIRIGSGLLPRLDRWLKEFCPSGKVAVVANRTVYRHYGRMLEGILRKGFQVETIQIPDGEKYKTLDTASKVFDWLIRRRYGRDSLLVAFGGGVVGDLTGFVASVYLRGIPYVQVPTTLLSQVDSSVGGKTAVDHPAGKNLIGSFYQPRLVVIDTDTLKTLPGDEFLGGLAEVIKYGIIADAPFFRYLAKNRGRILKREPAAMEKIISTSCRIKAEVVSGDERESGRRAILNYGHTIGHAVESAMGYSGITHGMAVASGMVAAAWISSRIGLIPETTYRKVEALVRGLGLPVRLPPTVKWDLFEDALLLDKKVQKGKIRFVLIEGIGKTVFRDDVPEHVLKGIFSIPNN